MAGEALTDSVPARTILDASPGAVTRDSMIAIIGGLVSQGFKFLTLIYVARRFSAAQFGMVVFAMAVNAFIFVASTFGLPVFGTREISKRGYVSSRLLRSVILSRAVLSVLGTVGAVTILALMPTVGQRELAMVAIFGLSNLVLAGFLDWAFQGLARQHISAILNGIWQALWLVFIALGARWGIGVMAVPVAMFLAALLASIAGYAWLKWTGHLVQEPVSVSIARESWNTIRAGAHVGIGALLITVLVWTDAIIVRLFWDKHTVGLYGAGSRPGNALVMLCGFFTLGAFPRLSRASLNKEQFARCFQRAYNELALIYVPFGLWGVFYAREILLFVFKREEYAAAVPVFQAFQVAMVVMCINLLYGTGALLSHHKDKTYQKILLNTTILFVFLCALLTRLLGMIGTAISIPISQSISLAMFMKHSGDLVQSRHRQALLPPLLCAAGAVGVCKIFVLSLWPAVLVLLLAYLILLRLRARAAVLENALSPS